MNGIGYDEAGSLWWKRGVSTNMFRWIRKDTDVMELADFCVKNNCLALIFVEHMLGERVWFLDHCGLFHEK